MPLPLPLSGIIIAVLIALQLPAAQPSAPQPSAPQPSAPLPVSPDTALPGADAPKAAAAIGGTPYLDLLKHYREGRYEAAVKGMAVLREGRSTDRVFEELGSLAVQVAGASDPLKASRARQLMLANVWAIAFPAAAALHLETGYALMQIGSLPEARDHLNVARQILDYQRFTLVMKILADQSSTAQPSRLAAPTKAGAREIRPELREEHARFRRDINVGVMWALQSDPVSDRLVQHLERLNSEYPEDGDVTLALGAFEEYQSSSPVIRSMKPPTALMAAGPWRQNTQLMRLKSAEKYYREALKIDSSLTEARLRLGRVLQQRGLMQDARNELESVFGQPDAPAAIRYLASIFLIDVLEAQGNPASALARARDLVRRYPECQSSHLALSRALEARGQRDAALAALAPLWKEQSVRLCADPWWGYYLGQGWRLPLLFKSLREYVGGAK